MFKDDRYDTIKVISETSDTSIFLVRHRTLSENRILKRLSKKEKTFSGSFIEKNARKEAEVLKGLRHPGIPVLYDYWEDCDYIYIVEEYVQGTPLSEYLAWRDSISVEQICSFLVQICEILDYLHKMEPYPILYQDLKPEHLFLRGESLMLIDYGAALFVPRSGEAFQQFGTHGFCAPEILAGGAASVRADIYSAGRVAGLLVSHTKERVPLRVARLIKWAAREKPEDRPASALEYKKEWEKALCKASVSEKDSLPATIVVAGASHGVGATHIAIALTVFLNAAGRRAYFTDQTDSRSTQCMCENGPGFYEKDMVIYHHHFRAVLSTGPAVCQPVRQEGIRVVDAGCSLLRAQDADLVLYVIGSRPWQEHKAELQRLPNDALIIINPANRLIGIRLAGSGKRRLIGFPLDADPFTLSRRKKELFSKMMKETRIRMVQ